jgi:hypothetical protein
MFRLKQALILVAVFCGTFVAANTLLGLLAAHGFAFHYTPYWPINVFEEPETSRAYRIVLGAALFGAFIVSNRFLAQRDYPLRFVIIAGFALIVGSNLLQGWDGGFYRPIAEDEYLDEPAPQYYHDAIKITDAAEFFRRHNELQPTLLLHARTHPPGPVLLVYALWRALRDPALIAVAIAALAVPLGAFFLHRLLTGEMQRRTAGFVTFLFLLVPAVQIYYLATIDAIVAGLVLGVFCCFRRGGPVNLIASVALLTVSLLLTLLSLFVVPVMIGFELVRRRSVVRSGIVIGCVACAFALIYAATGYNIVQTFRTASAIENPNGFTALHAPLDYVVTRIEDVAEILLFLGPFLAVAVWRAYRSSRRCHSDDGAAALLAVGSVALLFLSGAFRVGETARACGFVYPFLLLPVAGYLEREKVASRARSQLAALVFGQTILMQIAGNYFW